MRIHTRRFRSSDLNDFQAYRTDPELARFQGWQVETDANALAFIEDMSTAPRLAHDIWLQMAICRSDEDIVIGDIGLHYDGGHAVLEIGYTLSRDYQGSGLAQRAVTLAVDWVQTIHPHTDILAITNTRNMPSIKLLERLGFERTSTEAFEDVLEHHYRLGVRFRHNHNKSSGV